MEVSLFTKYQLPIKSNKTERGELMLHFMEHINMARKGTTFKPLSMARIGVILRDIPTDALYTLKSKCDDAMRRNGINSFSKTFFWEIKVK